MVTRNKKGRKILAITVFVVALFLFANTSLAKIDIGRYIEKIKTSLDIEKSLIMSVVPDSKLKKILSSIITAKKTTSNITYGLLAISALNEMELMDMVMSQRYKMEARQYFNQVLDERLNIIDHCVNLSYDIQTILSSTKIIEPTTAMLLNTFQITDKIINIFIAFENVKTMKVYDGLWVYFDARNGGESHGSAWEDAKIIMNWAAKKPSWGSPSRAKNNKNNNDELESQFSTLFNEWGPYVSINGINEDYKEKIRLGLRNDLVFALDRYNLVEKEKELEPSLVDKTKLAIGNIIEKTNEIKEVVISLARKTQKVIQDNISITQKTKKEIVSTQNNYIYNQAMSLQLEKDISERLEIIKTTDKAEEVEEKVEEITELIIEEIEKDNKEFNQEIEHKITLEEIQEIYDEIVEKVDIISQEIAILVKERKELTLRIAEKEISEEENKEEQEIEEEVKEEDVEDVSTETTLCSITTYNSPKKESVIINEIAWMGTIESSSNEWIELKNISNNEINLNGWQIINKEEKIKIIIGQDYNLKPKEFFLLERTDDSSVKEIEADIIYTGAIKNSEETLYLFDNNCILQDKVTASPNWAVGDNTSKRTMERKYDLTWHTSSNIEGTPKDDNTGDYYPRRTGGSSSTAQTEQVSPSANILITEIQIENASSKTNDFIELYNPNTQEIDISQWSIQKTYCNSTTTYKKNFEAEDKIPAKGYFLIVYSNSTNQDLLNLADMTHATFGLAENNTVYLVTNQEKIENASDPDIIDMVGFGIDIIEFENLPAEGTPALNPPPDRSLGRKWLTTTENYIDTNNNQEDFELQDPTPGERNISLEKEEKIIASFTYNPENPGINDSVLFNAASSTSTPEITNYMWNFGDGTSTNTNNSTTTHSFPASGEYIITLTITNTLEATNSTSTTINIKEDENQLIAAFTYSPSNPNKDEEVFFDASSSSSTSEIVSYLWNFGDNNSTTTNNATTTHVFTFPGEFTTNLILTNQLEATSSSSTTISIAPTESTTSVIINEIAWMGTVANSADEWIELYNTTDSDIDLNGWTLSWRDTLIKISTSTTTATTTIKANSFYLIERSDDNTIQDVFADWVGPFTNTLSNDGEKIELKNNYTQIIDTADYSAGWIAGIASPQYISMERKDLNNNWASNNLIIKNGLDIEGNRINGTPKQQNSISITPTPVTELCFDENITEIIFSKDYHPYLIKNDLLIPENKKLIMEEGITIKLDQNKQITVEGNIETPATSTESIVFTSCRDDDYGGDTNKDGPSIGEPGDWGQIYFKNSMNSILNNIVVKYGGRFISKLPFTDNSYLTPINIEGGSIKLLNSIITDSLSRGVWLNNTSSVLDNVTFSNTTKSATTRLATGLLITEGLPSIQNCTFNNNSIGIELNGGSAIINNCTFSNNLTGLQIKNGVPVISDNNFQNNENPIHLSLSASPVFSNNITQNNNLNGIIVPLDEKNITSTTTWSADLPYLVGQNINIEPEGSLIIRPGTIIKLKDWNHIDISGKILAQGTPEQQIIFTTLEDDDFGGDSQENEQKSLTWADNWKGLYFYSSGSILSNTIIKYGGTTFMGSVGAINIGEDVDILISDSTIRQNRCAFLLIPLPEESPTTTTAYCDSIKIKLDQLKTENTFCSNTHDTYPLCYFTPDPECNP